VALLFHGHTERAVEVRKENLRKGTEPAKSRRVEIDPSEKPIERTREKVQSVAGVSEHKARQALRVVALDAGGEPGGGGAAEWNTCICYRLPIRKR
jgi:hypothetical protein